MQPAAADDDMPAPRPSPAGTIARIFALPSRAAIYVGAVALLAMMGLTVADVVLRNLFSVVVPGGMEMTGLLMILVALSTLASVELEGGHIRVDLVLQALPEFARAPTIAGGLLLTCATMVVTGVMIWAQAVYLYENRIVTGVLLVPEWPFVACGTFFVFLFALALFRSFAAGVAAVARLRDARAVAILLAWIVVVAAILVMALYPQALPFDLPRETRGLAAIGLCFALIFLGVHVAAAMAVTSLVGISILIGANASLTSIGTTTIDVVSDQTWSVVPLFTWMGLIVVASGFAEDLYRAAYRWIGHLPGGLASASTVACAGLSSIVGDTLSGVYSMGSIALPQMRAYGYDMKLATASIACAATIGVMIPPSLAFIVYGMITEVSIGKLFMAGILPGILFTVILVSLITIRAKLNPALAPRGEVSTWDERMQSSARVWPIVLLMLLVLGGIYTGIVTPNEAGGLGVFGALVIAAAMRRLTWATLWHSIERTLSQKGGDIGFLPPPNKLRNNKEISRRVFELENIADFSEPYLHESVWHIVMLMDKRPARTRSLEGVSGEIRQTLYESRRKKVREELIEGLKGKAKIEVNQANLEKLQPPKGDSQILNKALEQPSPVRDLVPKDVKKPRKEPVEEGDKQENP